MTKFKFFSILDKSKEAIKTLNSPNISEAYSVAANIKRLSVEKFKKLFKIEKIK